MKKGELEGVRRRDWWFILGCVPAVGCTRGCEGSASWWKPVSSPAQQHHLRLCRMLLECEAMAPAWNVCATLQVISST